MMMMGPVQHVFHHVVIKIRQLFLQPAARLMSTLLVNGMVYPYSGAIRSARILASANVPWPRTLYRSYFSYVLLTEQA
jgi:hypothetical protein